jgi:hypothetical protein
MEGITEDNLTTSKELADTWGKSDHIEQIAMNKEAWTSNFGLRWNGMTAFVVIVPIPYSSQLVTIT